MEHATDHYVFHYPEHSMAQKDIIQISALQEECYAYISSCLGTESIGKIHYHLFNTPEEVGRQYAVTHDNDDDEPCNGFALPDTVSKDGLNHVYAVYSDTIQCIGFHEDAHIISYSLGRPVSQFIREGLAMFFDRYWWGIDNDSWSRWYLEQGKMPSIKDLLQNEYFRIYDDTITYPIAGAFTSYLIARYGMDRYIQFYQTSDDDAEQACGSAFHESITGIETGFKRYINLFHLRKEVRRLMAADLQIPKQEERSNEH